MVDRICDNCMSRVPADAEKCPKCGIRFENTNPGGALPNGWVLGGRYTIGRYIDIDGEGVTYSAIDGDTLQRVTVKEFMPVTLCATRDENGAIVAKPGCEVLFKTTRMDYSEMYGILLRLGLTEGLVQVLDVLEENNTAYAVLEKIEGPTLEEYLTKNSAPIEAARALSMLRPVMMGVEALHSANVVHRGISPENIILESGGTAKLCGFATLALRQQGSELKPKLYPGYSAPEQYAASEFEGRYTDVYALGAVLYRLLTGFAPPPADERKMQDNLRAPRAVSKAIQPFLSAAIVRALRIIPAERIQNVPDLRLALSGEGGKSARGPLGLTKQQLIVGACALGAIIILAVAILLVSLFSGRGEPDSESIPVSSSSSAPAVTELRVPNFQGMVYADVVKSSEYSDYTFDNEVEEEYSDDVDVGRIIRQTPEAGTLWTEDTVIKFVVSLGVETVDMPNFVSATTTKEQAIEALKALGIAENRIEVYNRSNDGSKTPGTVLQTDPAAGGKIELNGTGKIVLYVVGDVTTAKMPNLIGLAPDAAIAELQNLNIQYNDIVYVANDGRYVPGTVVEVSRNAGETINLANDKVTITVSNDVSMPNLVGKTLAEAQTIVDQLKNTNSKVSITLFAQEQENATVTPGTIISTSKDGGTVTNGEQVVVYVAKAPPAPPSSSEASSGSTTP